VLRTVGGDDLATPGLVVPPGAKPPPALTATSWLVADLDSGAVVGGCGPHEYSPPASVQKLLLAATVLPRLDPARVATVTRQDLHFEAGSSAVGLLLGGKYRVDLLWTGLLLNSGNDAANVLARLGGEAAGVPGTMAAMNAKARELGAYQTHAVTPSGLDAPGQFTSAYDLALIARACFADPTFRRYQTTQRAQIPPQPPKDKKGFQIQNDNRLLFEYPGALGGKTGFTDIARHTYVGFAERGGRRLVVTLLGAEARPLRGWQQGAALLDWGFAQPANASVGRLVAPGEPAPQPTPTGQDSTAADSRPVAQHSQTTPTRSQTLVPASAWTTGAAVGVAVALVLGPLVVLLVTRRGRRARVGSRGSG
jgi:D-alanyl-D-alanine carboxypeptidase (penicillin-binding protein 5/6)